jgi:hypothetical protein
MSGAEANKSKRTIAKRTIVDEPEEVTAMKRERKGTAPGGNSRREFLRTLGIGATAAAAAGGPLAVEARADTETNDEKRKSRYRETAEVQTFYRVNRYPS